MNPTSPRSWRRRLGALILGSSALTGLFPAPIAGAVDAGVIVTLAGSSVNTAPIRLNHPRTAAVSGRDIYFTDTDNNMIRKIDSAGKVTNIAGNGSAGYSGDGGPATQASIWRPHGVAVDSQGNVFIADSPNHRIRRVDRVTGIITTVAGSGQSGYSGDVGLATLARLDRPRFLVVAPDNSLIIADTGNRRVRKVSPTGVITTIAGNGETGSTGDGGPATAAELDDPRGLALDSAGNLYISNAEGSPVPSVRRVDAASGMITTVAGGNPAGFGGDGGPATSARLNEPRSIAVRGNRLYIADSINNRIRMVDLGSGIINTVAGTGKSGFGGDNGPATSARLAEPRGLTLTPGGDVVILDTNNNRVRMMGAPSGSGPAPGPVVPTAELSGRILDRADRATAAAMVKVLAGGEEITSVRPDSNGAFAVGLDDGDYSLTAQSSIGCTPLRASPVPVVVRGGVANPPSTTLSLGRADARPVAFEPVTVKVDANRGEATTRVETPAGDVNLRFEGVTQNGSVTASCRDGAWDAGEHELLDTGVSLSATGLRFSTVTVCLSYTPAQAAARFGSLDVDGLLDVVQLPAGTVLPTGHDADEHVVCGRSTSLTDVAVGVVAPSGGTTYNPTLDPDAAGYRLVAGDGGIFAYGDAGFFGSTGAVKLNQPIVTTAGTPSGQGYWLVASDGGIFAFGDAAFYGSTGAVKLNRPIVGMAPTPSGQGYWLVASDGGIFAFGDAAFYGSTGAVRLNQPIAGMAATPSGKGYWLVASDGGMFSFGDAAFHGSTGAVKLNRPIVGMAPTPSGQGYWLVASDGGMFSFGDAAFSGSTGAVKLNRPIVGMAPTPSGQGYWLVASDGGVFAFGDAPFLGSAGALKLVQPVVAITSL